MFDVYFANYRISYGQVLEDEQSLNSDSDRQTIANYSIKIYLAVLPWKYDKLKKHYTHTPSVAMANEILVYLFEN